MPHQPLSGCKALPSGLGGSTDGSISVSGGLINLANRQGNCQQQQQQLQQQNIAVLGGE